MSILLNTNLYWAKKKHWPIIYQIENDALSFIPKLRIYSYIMTYYSPSEFNNFGDTSDGFGWLHVTFFHLQNNGAAPTVISEPISRRRKRLKFC
jgi:hypothetical protein